MIEIQNINNNSIEDVVNLLLDEKVQPFKIYAPKSTQLFASTNIDIANDYAMLVFVGQKLSEVADEFSYYYISPSDHESVLFEVKAINIKQLAEVLLDISYGYNNKPEGEEVYCLDEAYDLIDKVESGNIIPACPDFVEDYQEYLKLAKENNDDDE